MEQTKAYSPLRSDLGPRVPVFALRGPTKGPRLVVTGPDALVRTLADMLWIIPDLATIGGNVFLRPDDQDTNGDRPDVILVLDSSDDGQACLTRVLDHMRALGMIPAEVRTAA